MKKPFVALVVPLLVGMSFSLPALDWGSTIDTSSDLNVGTKVEDTVIESARVSAFLRHTVSDRLTLSAKGSYRFQLELPLEGDPEIDPYFLDLNHLYMTGDLPVTGAQSVVSYRAGRFRFSDGTGLILADTLDGARVRIATERGSVRLGAGYSGLTAADSSTIEMSKADTESNADEETYTAPPRAFGLWEVRLPQIIGSQEIGVSALYAQDLRKRGDLSDGQGRVTALYSGGHIRGPIVPGLRYRAFGVFQTGDVLSDTGSGYEYKAKLAYLAGARLRYLNRDALYSLVELRYLHSSGDADYRSYYEGNTGGTAEMFTGVSNPGLGLVFAPRLGNLMTANLAYSFRPLSGLPGPRAQQLQIRLDSYAFLRETGGAISEGGLRAGSTDRYVGAEADLSVNYRPFSDLGLGVAGGVFLPNTYGSESVFDPEQRDIEYVVRVTTSFSF